MTITSFGGRLVNASLALTAGTRVGNALAALFNRYEGAMPSGPTRSFIPALLQDARYDADQMSRSEMARKIRYFERNLWLIQRLREVYTKYTVGPNGMPVIPATSDPEWNKRMLEAYETWCESPGRDSLLPMSQLHRLMAGETHIDGEVFWLLTYRKELGRQSIPAVQLIESHRIGVPGQYNLTDTTNNVDGVELNADGRPIGFWIRDGVKDDSWTFRNEKEVIQVGDPERVAMYRYVTPYHATLNTSHDLDDLEALEMERARNNAGIANIIKNAAGEFNPADLHRMAFSRGSGNLAGNTASADEASRRQEMFKRILGSRTIALKAGEDIDQLDGKHPSAATQWLWQYKISQVSVSVNIPMMLVLPESVQGTVARAVLDDAHQSFRAKFAVFATAARRIYRHYAQWARYNVAGLYDGPADWWKCHVIPPRACNVDYGRNSAATLAELAAGVTNWDDIAGAAGTTAETLIRKKARNIALIKQIAEEEGVDPAEISAPLADVLQKLAAADATDPNKQDAQPKEEPVTA